MISRRRLVFASGAATVPRMLSERPYRQGDYPRDRTSVLTWIISALAAGFVLQLAFGLSWFDGRSEQFNHALGLTVSGLQAGRFWTLLTHPFLHSTAFLFHVVGILFALFFLGRELLPLLGPRRFVGVLISATVVSGITWSAAHWPAGGGDMHLGAAGAVAALFVIFARFFPNRELNFLLFFLFPVTLKPKHVAYGFAAFSLFGLLFFELPGADMPFGIIIASSAHLGGMATGLAYHRLFHPSKIPARSRAADRMALQRPAKGTAESSPILPPVPVPYRDNPKDIRVEVDRVLDKINSHGFGSLTVDERRVLDDAKALLSRR